MFFREQSIQNINLDLSIIGIFVRNGFNKLYNIVSLKISQNSKSNVGSKSGPKSELRISKLYLYCLNAENPRIITNI